MEGTRFPILLGGIIVFFGIAHGVVQWQGGLKSADVALEYQFQRSTSINRIKIFKSWTIPD